MKKIVSNLKEKFQPEVFLQKIEEEEKEMNDIVRKLKKKRNQRTSYYKLLMAHEDIQRDYLEKIQVSDIF